MALEIVYTKEELKKKYKIITIKEPSDFNKLKYLKMNTTAIVIFCNSINMYQTFKFEPINAENADIIILGFNNTLENLRIYKPDYKFVGLFSKVRNLSIKDLNIKNIKSFGEEVTGSIAGEVVNNLTLDRINSMTYIHGDAICGGICGIAENIKATNSCINSSVSGRGILGGICGMATTYKKDNVYVTTLLNDSYRKILNDTSTNREIGYLSTKAIDKSGKGLLRKYKRK